MQLLRPSSDLRGLATSVLVAVVLASVVSVLLVFVLPGGQGSLDDRLPETGPLGRLVSDIVAFVWLGLFAGLGVAYWLTARSRFGSDRALLGLWALVLVCMTYPMLGFAVQTVWVAVLGNLLTASLAAFVAVQGLRVSVWTAAFPALVSLWIGIATAGLIALGLGLPF